MTFEDYSGFKTEDLMRKKGILDIYKLNISHVINIMFKVKIIQYQNHMRIIFR